METYPSSLSTGFSSILAGPKPLGNPCHSEVSKYDLVQPMLKSGAPVSNDLSSQDPKEQAPGVTFPTNRGERGRIFPPSIPDPPGEAPRENNGYMYIDE